MWRCFNSLAGHMRRVAIVLLNRQILNMIQLCHRLQSLLILQPIPSIPYQAVQVWVTLVKFVLCLLVGTKGRLYSLAANRARYITELWIRLATPPCKCNSKAIWWCRCKFLRERGTRECESYMSPRKLSVKYAISRLSVTNNKHSAAWLWRSSESIYS